MIYTLLFLIGCIPKINQLQKNGIVITKEILLVCNDKEEECAVALNSSIGSATRVYWNGKHYWLTAGHVCTGAAEVDGAISAERMIKVVEAGSGRETLPEKIMVNQSKDLCLLSAESGPHRKISESEPQLGSVVQAIAYPGGAFDPNIYPLYDGRWAGRMKSEDRCIVTMPVAGGSSGAAVLNDRGEVVGVVSSVMKSFNHFTLSTCLSDVKTFLEQASNQE